MTTARVPDALTIHQLLGRVVYFHVLFIAPEPSDTRRAASGPACCNHRASGPQYLTAALEGSAWGALMEIAAELPDSNRPCPHVSDTCCATCRITSAASAVGSRWVATEHRAYHRSDPGLVLVDACGRAAAARLGRVFADQHGVSCAVLDRFAADPPVPASLPGMDELPLTGELLALWADPAVTSHSPVASWLNHCTGGLDDVRRVLESRRTAS
ncbi:hypothetical protein ACFWF9_24115 [Streptomyces roseolus]|uniref:hypothetical protein n=1 Tax=Streptomyces roseolus TaxID=67358 RepID=UPI003652A2BA